MSYDNKRRVKETEPARGKNKIPSVDESMNKIQLKELSISVIFTKE